MRVTIKGQVTIPRRIRELLGIVPETEIDFVEKDGRVYIVKTSKDIPTKKFRGKPCFWQVRFFSTIEDERAISTQHSQIFTLELMPSYLLSA